MIGLLFAFRKPLLLLSFPLMIFLAFKGGEFKGYKEGVKSEQEKFLENNLKVLEKMNAVQRPDTTRLVNILLDGTF